MSLEKLNRKQLVFSNANNDDQVQVDTIKRQLKLIFSLSLCLGTCCCIVWPAFVLFFFQFLSFFVRFTKPFLSCFRLAAPAVTVPKNHPAIAATSCFLATLSASVANGRLVSFQGHERNKKTHTEWSFFSGRQSALVNTKLWAKWASQPDPRADNYFVGHLRLSFFSVWIIANFLLLIWLHNHGIRLALFFILLFCQPILVDYFLVTLLRLTWISLSNPSLPPGFCCLSDRLRESHLRKFDHFFYRILNLSAIKLWILIANWNRIQTKMNFTSSF